MRWTSILKGPVGGGPYQSMGGPLVSLIFKVNPAFKKLQNLRRHNPSTSSAMKKTSILELPGDFVPSEFECYQELLGQYKAWRPFQIQTTQPTIRQESGKNLIGFDVVSNELYSLRRHLQNAFYQVASELEKPRMCRPYIPVCQMYHDTETTSKIKAPFRSGLRPLTVVGLSLASQVGARGSHFRPIGVIFEGRRPEKPGARHLLPKAEHLENIEPRSDVPVNRRVTGLMQRSDEPHQNHMADSWRTGQSSPDSAKPPDEHDVRANSTQTEPSIHRSTSRWAPIHPLIRLKPMRTLQPSLAMVPRSPSELADRGERSVSDRADEQDTDKRLVHIPRDVLRPRIDDPNSWKKTISSLF